MSRLLSGRRRIQRLDGPLGMADVLIDFARDNIFSRQLASPRLPTALTVYVTYRCNMRCRICGIWKTNASAGRKELALEEWGRILSDPLFSRLEMVNINGGEPNLREDLVALVERIAAGHHRLSALSLNSNGIPPEKTILQAEQLSGLCKKKNIRFSISLSLHSVGEGFDQITGLRDSYSKLRSSFAGLKRLRRTHDFYLAANCVICRLNLSHLDEMLAWSQREDIPINFVLGEVRDRFLNVEMEEDILLKDEDKPAVIAFLRKLASQKRRFGQHALRYRHLADMLEKARPRSLACHYFLSGAVLGSDGLLFYCKNSDPIGDCQIRSAQKIYLDPTNAAYRIHGLQRDRCLRCPPYTMNRIEVAHDLLKIVSDFVLRP